MTERYLQRLLHDGRIPGAKKYGASWMIPANAEKPGDPRRTAKSRVCTPPHYVYYGACPLPIGDPDGAFSFVPEKYHAAMTADLAYRRGDPEPAKDYWRLTGEEDEAKLLAASVATVAAISSGDYPLYYDIRLFLDRCISGTNDPEAIAYLSIPESVAAVSMVSPGMTPEWLINCDFSLFSSELAPFLLYLYTMHLRNIGDKSAVLATARASSILCSQRNSFTWIDVHNLVLCATASYSLGRLELAERYLLAAIDLGLPYGFITPFADCLGSLGGLPESCINRRFPQYWEPMLSLWESSFKNWMAFHNRFTRDNITTVLTPREYQTANLIAHGASYAEAAARMNLSVGRIKNILTAVYGKLYINKREQLRDLIL